MPLTASTQLAATWFAPNERITVITLIVIGQIFGIAIGYVFPIIYFHEDMKREIFRHTMVKFLGMQAILSGVQTVLNAIFYREKPPTPAGPEPVKDEQ